MRIYIAGINGLVGSNVKLKAEEKGHEVFGKPSKELDMTDRNSVFLEMQNYDIDVLVIAAAKVGGIGANDSSPVDFLSTNLQIQTNLIDAAFTFNFGHVVFLGSSCIYPKHVQQPMEESMLMTGKLEPTNQAYAVAKLAGVELLNSYRKQYGKQWISVLPCNLYGPQDNFNPNDGHVLASLMQKIHAAKVTGNDFVTIWGDGTPTREFLYVEDAAQAIVKIFETKIVEPVVNLGSGDEISIKNLAILLAEVIGFTGKFIFDPTKPNGTPRKVLEISKLSQYGWKSATNLRNGISQTYDWYLDNYEKL